MNMQNKGDIHAVANHSGVHSVIAAHRAQDNRANMNAYTNPNAFIAGFSPVAVIYAKGFLQVERCIHRIGGFVGASAAGVVKQGHNGVADKFIDEAAVLVNGVIHAQKIGIEKVH